MAFNILAKEVTLRVARVPKKKKTVSKKAAVKTKGKPARAKATAEIDKSADLTGIELRLLPPYIIDNNTSPFLMFKGYAKVYCVVIVVSDANSQLVGGIDLQGFPRIGDKEHLPINKSIYYWQKQKSGDKPPSQIHTMVSVIKSKAGLRKAGEIMTKLKADEGYKSIVEKLAAGATGAGAVVGIVTELGGIVGKYLGEVEDKPLGTVINSYTSLYGDFDTPGVTRKQYKTKKVTFDLEIIVRDGKGGAEGVKTAAKKQPPAGPESVEMTKIS